jgi:hypothetical protein
LPLFRLVPAPCLSELFWAEICFNFWYDLAFSCGCVCVQPRIPYTLVMGMAMA